MLNYFYDKEADTFYFSQGKPAASDETVEMGDDVLVRMSTRTKKVRGFTLLNASRRGRAAQRAAALPFSFVPA